MFNENNLIDFSTLNSKLYGSKECILCDDATSAKTGTFYLYWPLLSQLPVYEAGNLQHCNENIF